MLSQRQIEFFLSFSGFVPRSDAGAEHEFLRLAVARQWKRGGKKHRRHYRELKSIEKSENQDVSSLEYQFENLNLSTKASTSNSIQHVMFERSGGVSINDQPYAAHNHLKDLQQLCIDLGHENAAPPTITQCKKFLSGVFVNIYDYISCKREDRAVEPIFRQRSQLITYTVKGAKIFPKKAAKSDPVLKSLLEVLR